LAQGNAARVHAATLADLLSREWRATPAAVPPLWPDVAHGTIVHRAGAVYQWMSAFVARECARLISFGDQIASSWAVVALTKILLNADGGVGPFRPSATDIALLIN